MSSVTQDALKFAATSGDILTIRNYCQLNGDKMSLTSAQELLATAAQASQVHVVEFLLHQFPNLKIDDATVRAAAGVGSIPLFTTLSTRDPSAPARRFERSGTALTSACTKRQPVEFLRYLLQNGADPNQQPDTMAYPLALVAAFYKDQSAIDLMLEHGANIEHSGALALAARVGNEASLHYLLSKGAQPDTDAMKIAGDHPLHEALWGGHVGAAKILLEHGCSTDVLNRNGKSLAEIAAHLEGQGQDRTEFMALLSQFGGAGPK